MTREITELPWGGDSEAYSKTRKNIFDSTALYELETEHGALIYAAIGNIAAEKMDYPDEVIVEVPQEAREDAEEFVEGVMHDDSEESARALFSLISDVSDHSDDYLREWGHDNVKPLLEQINEIRGRWQKNNDFENW